MNKNIIICGVLDKEYSANVWIASAFSRLGFNIIPINYRNIKSQYDDDYLCKVILYAVSKYNPELVIFCKFNAIHPKVTEEVSKVARTFLFFMDSHIIAQNAPEIVEHAKNCKFSSCTSVACVDYFDKQGVTNCYHIFEGAHPDIHKPVEFNSKFESTISFIGANTHEREAIYKFLLDNGVDAKFYGPGWKSGQLTMEDYATISSSSKFMLSVSTFNDIPSYFSARVFELLSCGSCVLHFDTTSTCKNYFTVGKELLTFSNNDELLNLIKTVSDKQAVRIGIEGRERVMRDYTWYNTAKNILEVVNGKNTYNS